MIHGAQDDDGFLNRSVPFVDAVLRSMEEEDALNRAATLLYEAERRHGIAFLEAPVTFALDRDPDDGGWSNQVLQPFLDETHFLLTGAACQRLGLYDTEGFDRMYSWRHWGAEIAQWANRHVMPRKDVLNRETLWDYLTFYSEDYVTKIVDGYAEWERALFSVVNRKTAIYGWTFSPHLISISMAELRKSGYFKQIQLVNNQVHACLPPTETDAKVIIARLSEKLRGFVVQNQLGRFYPEGTRFVMSTERDTVMSPLGAFISRQRKPMKSRAGWIAMVPDMVVEARSQLDVQRRLDTKIAWWLAAGVPVVWVLDAGLRQFTIHSQGKTSVMISSRERLYDGKILPGFELPVESLFS